MIDPSEFVLGAFRSLIEEAKIDINNIGTKAPIPIFPSSILSNLIELATKVFMDKPNVIRIKSPVVIVGDLHGSLLDLLRIIAECGMPPDTSYLFLGDYVDRGQFSLEIITFLLALIVAHPDNVTLLRGNHEFENINSIYGFKDEIRRVYPVSDKILQMEKEKQCQKKGSIPRVNSLLNDELKLAIANPHQSSKADSILFCDNNDDNNSIKINNLTNEINLNENSQNSTSDSSLADHTLCNNDWSENQYKMIDENIDLFSEFNNGFNYMPLAAIIDEKTFCVHGGLSSHLKTIAQIEVMQRPITEYTSSPLLTDIMWSDPMKNIFDYSPSMRGAGCYFGEKAITEFLSNNNLNSMIRAHQCVLNGVEVLMNRKIATIFSCSSYNSQKNKSGIMLKASEAFNMKIFDPLPRLDRNLANFFNMSLTRRRNVKKNFCLRSLKSYSYKLNVSSIVKRAKSPGNGSLLLHSGRNRCKRHASLSSMMKNQPQPRLTSSSYPEESFLSPLTAANIV